MFLTWRILNGKEAKLLYMDDSEFVKKSLKKEVKEIQIKDGSIIKKLRVELKSRGKIRNLYGEFWLFLFEIDDEWKEYYVLVKTKLNSELTPNFTSKEVVLRIDSACITGNLFLDNSCDCKLQLETSMKIVSNSNEGLIIYIPRHDGRGLGLENKLPTLSLVYDMQYDTIKAFKKVLNCNITDKRSYSGAIAILKFFKISNDTNFILLTRSKNKLKILNDNNYLNVKFIDISNSYNEIIARNKKAKNDDENCLQ